MLHSFRNYANSSPGHEPVLSGKVPLAVLHEQVPREEEQGEREEGQEGVVGEAVHDAVDVAQVPGVGDDLGVEGEGHAEARQEDVADGQVQQKVVAWTRGKQCSARDAVVFFTFVTLLLPFLLHLLFAIGSKISLH